MSVASSKLGVGSSAPRGAVFLSYASQDAEAAKRIADALRAAGVEVWFDQNELVGGDAWDQKIRKQIAECALFVPVISAHTQARLEGYFRLEWKIAAQRTHTMADERVFLLPVVIDATRDAEAKVPTEFKGVQWTRLPEGGPPGKFCERVKGLLAGVGEPGRAVAEAPSGAPTPQAGRRRPAWLGGALIAVPLLVGLGFAWRMLSPQGGAPDVARETKPAVVALSPAQELVAKARTILDQGDELNRETYVLAEELLIKAEQLDVSEPSAWILHAQVSSALIGYGLDDTTTRREALRAQANRAVQLAPASLDAQLAECDALIAFGQNIPAIVERLQGLAAQHPENWRVFDLLCEGLRIEGKSTEALAANDRALRLAPDNFLLKGNRVALYSRSGDWAAMEKEVAGMMQGRTSARLLAYDALVKLGWRGDAAGALAAVQGWPAWFLIEDRGVVHAVYAALWSRNPNLALQFVQKYSRDYIRDYLFTGPTAVLSAWANEQAGNTAAARADWLIVQQVTERELRARPNEAYALHWRAWALARLGDRAAAESILQQLVEGNASMRNMSRVLGRYGALALSVGRTDVALAQLAKEPRTATRAILRLNPVFDPLRSDPRFQALVESAPGPQEIAPTTLPSVALAKEDKSVAVLAFANLSDDKSNEYFSDGISEELLNVLAKVPGLKVTARTSAFHFKGKDTPIPEIAKQLGVAYVVEGSVRKAGDKVRITAQLIKAADGFHVWSDTFTRDLKDIFAVQDEIAGLIAQQLQLKLAVGSDRGTVDPALYEMLLQARSLTLRESNEDWRQAIALYRRALAREPRLALAWAEMARTYVQLGRFGGMPIQEAMREARAAAQRALELEPDQATGLVALGWVQRTADWDWHGARQSFQRALELAPGNASVMGDVAVFYFNTGRVAEAKTLARQAVERDPLNARAQASLGFILNLNGDWEQALGPLRQAVALAPSIEEVRSHQARALMALGRGPEAAAAAEQEPNEAYRLIARAFSAGPAADAALAEFVAKYGEEMPGYVANIHGIRGEIDPAFAWFERALARRDAAVAWVKTNVNNRSLRTDPRWPIFLRKVGLADDQLK